MRYAWRNERYEIFKEELAGGLARVTTEVRVQQKDWKEITCTGSRVAWLWDSVISINWNWNWECWKTNCSWKRWTELKLLQRAVLSHCCANDRAVCLKLTSAWKTCNWHIRLCHYACRLTTRVLTLFIYLL